MLIINDKSGNLSREKNGNFITEKNAIVEVLKKSSIVAWR